MSGAENEYPTVYMAYKLGGVNLSSSISPDQLSARVQGAILAFSGLVLAGARLIGVPLIDSEMAQFASQAGMAAGGLWFLFGFVRMLIVRFSERGE